MVMTCCSAKVYFSRHSTYHRKSILVKRNAQWREDGNTYLRIDVCICVQVWRLDLGLSSPRRTHDVKIGYIPILMLILSVTASQVLVVPKIVRFSIPRCEPEPKPCTPWGQKCRPSVGGWVA
jgi:hypothetical protein